MTRLNWSKSIQTWPKASLTWVVSCRRFCPLLASLSPLQEKTQSYHNNTCFSDRIRSYLQVSYGHLFSVILTSLVEFSKTGFSQYILTFPYKTNMSITLSQNWGWRIWHFFNKMHCLLMQLKWINVMDLKVRGHIHKTLM